MPESQQASAASSQRNRPVSTVILYVLLAYTLLLIYGTLFPLQEWDWNAGNLQTYLAMQWPRYFGTGDLIVNVLVFMPFGLLLARILYRRMGLLSSILLTTLLGTLLSASVEYLQMFLPGRVSSPMDIALNGSGSLIGACLQGIMRTEGVFGRYLLARRQCWFVPGRQADLGILVLALWVLSQLSPLVPSFDLGLLKDGLRTLWQTLQTPQLFDTSQAAVYLLNIASLALISRIILINQRGAIRWFAVFAVSVLVLKIPVVSRELSAEALVGLMAGLLVATLLRAHPTRRIIGYAAVLLFTAVVTETLRGVNDPNAAMHSFNWIPFAHHISSLVGIGDILNGIWPYIGLAFLTMSLQPRGRRAILLLGAVLIFVLLLGLEWMQQYVPGRQPDITDALLPVFAWTLPWLHPELRHSASLIRPVITRPHPSSGQRVLFGSIFALMVVGIGLIAVSQNSPVTADASNTRTMFPLPEELMPASFDAFRYTHPRLPLPSEADLAILRKHNPSYFKHLERDTRRGKGQLDRVINQATFAPDSIDLDKLFKRLMRLDFTYRGHNQAMPLAKAYDWLYDYWTEEQRAGLLTQTIKAGEYIIRVIRKERLSPYNVSLYNAPLQALIAVAIVIHDKNPRATPVVAFTNELLMNRVVPAWKQVMGNNGGWHEGGEYVGLGIGRALFTIPDMWLHATGIDLYAEVPGIKGFLDFQIYRQRPDNTEFRWGDAQALGRDSDARKALAVEFNHKAAFSAFWRSKPYVITAWPWGPLPLQHLVDPTSIEDMPTDAWFDGLGLFVARSNWSDDATYVTFKAGDNYWSHSHLDQGAFTIYKGGALAIDSGVYGPHYGSDHHMNYAYQSIAHNLITVTDEADTVPSLAKKKTRIIANDGGQRRIGSGWGQESAPIDFREWKDKEHIYHTASILDSLREDGFTVAVADLTPAYTNKLSGTGTFEHRTRRVERYTRTFGYDKGTDTIVVYDQIKSTQAHFRKRWLLHSMEQPLLTPDGFRVSVVSSNRRGHSGGSLLAHVVLPRQYSLNVVGGPAAEFLVDGVNYDEDGKVWERPRKKPKLEPGHWRVELSPPHDATDDEFLVVLIPSLGQLPSDVLVTPLSESGRTGVEIQRGDRRTRWWTIPDRAGLEIEKLDAYTLPQQWRVSAEHPLPIPMAETGFFSFLQ